MREDTSRAVFHPGRKDREVAWTGKQKERAVTEQAGVPVLQVVAGQEFAFEVDEAFIVHRFHTSLSYRPFTELFSEQ